MTETKNSSSTEKLSRVKPLIQIVEEKVGSADEIEIINIFADRYRINIWNKVSVEKQERGKGFYEVKDDVNDLKTWSITSSFFVVYDKNKGLMYSNPPIT